MIIFIVSPKFASLLFLVVLSFYLFWTYQHYLILRFLLHTEWILISQWSCNLNKVAFIFSYLRHFTSDRFFRNKTPNATFLKNFVPLCNFCMHILPWISHYIFILNTYLIFFFISELLKVGGFFGFFACKFFLEFHEIFIIIYFEFQNYRKGGEIGETDDDTATDSATDAINTSDDEGN